MAPLDLAASKQQPTIDRLVTPPPTTTTTKCKNTFNKRARLTLFLSRPDHQSFGQLGHTEMDELLAIRLMAFEFMKQSSSHYHCYTRLDVQNSSSTLCILLTWPSQNNARSEECSKHLGHVYNFHLFRFSKREVVHILARKNTKPKAEKQDHGSIRMNEWMNAGQLKAG